MAFITEQIHAGASETELEYVQRIIDTITGIDDRITCNTTAAAQYADTSATATFDFDIDGKYAIRFKRAAVNSSNARGFIVSIIVNEVEYAQSGSTLRFWYAQTTSSGAVQNGWFKTSAYATDNTIFIWFGAHHDTEISDICPSMYASALITDGDNVNYANGVASSNDIASASFYKTDDGTSGFSLPKLLAYTDALGMISIIKNGNPIKSAGGFVSFAKDLIPSSTRTVGDQVVFDGHTYFAVGTNLLIKEVAA